MRSLALLALLCGVLAGPPASGEPGGRAGPDRALLAFDDLDGWAEDDHEAALGAFLRTCDALRGLDWPALCALARDLSPGAARGFFEAAFRPVLTTDGRAALLTGYYEPELEGSRRRTARFRHPLYARPSDLPEDGPGPTRREIDRGALAGRGLEIAWVADPVQALFLGIQGSGRVRLAEGGTLRLGYGGANGHVRRSIGVEMARRGLIEPWEASAEAISAYVRAHPREGRELLRHDPSYVFFREVEGLSDDAGPLGAMRRPLTPGRSVAVDPRRVPLGAPVWVERGGAEPMRRLMVAQDTGSAIRGAQRADLFLGTGPEAGRRAGRVRDRGRIVALLPIRMARALASEPPAPDVDALADGAPPERSRPPPERPGTAPPASAPADRAQGPTAERLDAGSSAPAEPSGEPGVVPRGRAASPMRGRLAVEPRPPGRLAAASAAAGAPAADDGSALAAAPLAAPPSAASVPPRRPETRP